MIFNQVSLNAGDVKTTLTSSTDVAVEIDVIADALAVKPEPVDVSGPVVLYGAGSLGRWTLAAMRRAGLPDPIAIIDKESKEFEGFWTSPPELLPCSPRAAGFTIKDDPLVVVTIYAGERVRWECRARGWRTCSFAQFYRAALLGKPGVPTHHGAVAAAEDVLRQEPFVRAAYKLWADDASRAEYVEQVRYRVSLQDPRTPKLPIEGIYFPPEQPFRDRETFVDCGAYDGDTLKAFANRAGYYNQIVAIEPDPSNLAKLREHGLPRTQVIEAAVSNRDGFIRFVPDGPASRIDGDGEQVRCVKLDSVLTGMEPTRIKMDVEGAEPMALVGAAKTIRKHKPLLAVCLYHAPDHLWQVPMYLKHLVPEYRIYLQRYADDCWETVCYAVP